MSSPPDETSLAETGLQSGADGPPSGGSGSGAGASRPGWLASSAPAGSHETLAPGTLLAERYRILGLVGRGGMGEVYRAEDLRLGQNVALKFLPNAVAGDPQRLAQFHHEVRIARQVSHRNVCRVYDIGEDHGRVFLTMELIDGEDLAVLLKRVGRFPEERATEIARLMVMKYGMSERVGLATFGEWAPHFLKGGLPWGGERDWSEDTARVIDSEVRDILDRTHDRVRAILTTKKGVLVAAAAELRRVETLEGDRLRRVLAGDKLEET